MNTTNTKQSPAAGQTISQRCLQSCKKLLAGIERVKDKIAAEFHEFVETNEKLFHLALNEAEALAWDTEYPQLVFPTLALEKVRAVAEWQSRQQSIR